MDGGSLFAGLQAVGATGAIMGALPVVAGIGALVGLGLWALNRKWFNFCNFPISLSILLKRKVNLYFSLIPIGQTMAKCLKNSRDISCSPS